MKDIMETKFRDKLRENDLFSLGFFYLNVGKILFTQSQVEPAAISFKRCIEIMSKLE